MNRSVHTRFDFDGYARDYEHWYETAQGKAHDCRQQAAVSRALPSPAPGARLLDIGCGTGHWSRFYASKGFSVAGVDLSAPMVREAHARDTGHSFYGVADAYNLPFRDAAFDVVSAMAVLEFVSRAEAVLAEMIRCVREHGPVIVGTLNRLAPLNRTRVADGKQPYASARMLAPAELTALLAPYGEARLWMADPEADGMGNGLSAAFMVAQVLR
ncbi:MAG: class I SAM-dependent methyltransferase [Candidatus Hydrogenedentes bacterium]|nr:class I SAM-dependent methyltransferase [Candidatus Hydrogenedentota bacterium]